MSLYYNYNNYVKHFESIYQIIMIIKNYSPRLVLEYKDQDPFCHMILKHNKSPILKPICVKPRSLLSKSKSTSQVVKISALPPVPLASRYKISIDLPRISSVRTPTFNSTRLRKIKNYSELKQYI